jgi:hypothetical protein
LRVGGGATGRELFPTDEEESTTWTTRRSRGSLCLHRLKAIPLDLFRSRSICAAVLLAGRLREEARWIEAGTARLLCVAGLRIDVEKGGGLAHRRTDGGGEGQGRRWQRQGRPGRRVQAVVRGRNEPNCGIGAPSNTCRRRGWRGEFGCPPRVGARVGGLLDFVFFLRAPT